MKLKANYQTWDIDISLLGLANFFGLCCLAGLFVVLLAVSGGRNTALALESKDKHTDPTELIPGPATNHSRVLLFPMEYSLGSITLEPVGTASGAKKAGCAARGKVVVPANMIVRFIPTLHFYRNPATCDTLPADAIDIIELTASSLDDSEDGLCDRALGKLGHMKGLISLDLDRSDASDAGVTHAAQLPELQRVSLFSTTIHGKCFEQLAGLKKVRYMRLGHNGLEESSLHYLSQMPGLKVLDVVGCNIADGGVEQLSHCPNLVSIALDDNSKITDRSIKYIRAMKQLKHLGLRRTAISFDGLLQLQGINYLNLELPSSRYSRAQMAAIKKAFPQTAIIVPGDVHKIDSETRTLFAPLH